MSDEEFVKMSQIYDAYAGNMTASKAAGIKKMAPYVPVEIYTNLDEDGQYYAMLQYLRSQIASRSNPSGSVAPAGGQTSGPAGGGLSSAFKKIFGKNDAAGFVTDWVTANRK